jgi:L-fuconolactonase
VILDAHHHLWDPARREYPWMAGPELEPLRRRFGVDDLRAVAEPLGVSATVVVQALGSEEETSDLLRAAAGSRGLIAGVVGWVDLTAPDVGARLAGRPGLVGVRHQVQDEPDAGWLERPDVLRGLRAAASAGLRYDLLVRPEHLPAALTVAVEVPELALVVDHGAKPEVAAGGWEPWSRDLAALAGCEQVHCKLSGLVTEARWRAWRSDGIERYIGRLLDLFGPERLMFGSDWPVCTLAASYQEVLELARETLIALGCGESELAAVLGGTARRFYGVGAASSGAGAAEPDSRAPASHSSTPAT